MTSDPCTTPRRKGTLSSWSFSRDRGRTCMRSRGCRAADGACRRWTGRARAGSPARWPSSSGSDAPPQGTPRMSRTWFSCTRMEDMVQRRLTVRRAPPKLCPVFRSPSSAPSCCPVFPPPSTSNPRPFSPSFSSAFVAFLALLPDQRSF
jgi:hypothetical protein